VAVRERPRERVEACGQLALVVDLDREPPVRSVVVRAGVRLEIMRSWRIGDPGILQTLLARFTRRGDLFELFLDLGNEITILVDKIGRASCRERV